MFSLQISGLFVENESPTPYFFAPVGETYDELYPQNQKYTASSGTRILFVICYLQIDLYDGLTSHINEKKPYI